MVIFFFRIPYDFSICFQIQDGLGLEFLTIYIDDTELLEISVLVLVCSYRPKQCLPFGEEPWTRD